MRRLLTILVALTAAAMLGAAAPEAPGAADFVAIASVLTSPRCKNCHPADGVPRVGDDDRLHRMNISRRSVSAGLPCSTCHRSSNAPFAHGPPGVPGWRMPGDERPMPFAGKTVGQLCVDLKDPGKNGGKALGALREHFEGDPLVAWAWSPGPGRTVPPLAHAELMKHVDAWIGAGAPCPL